jgi:pentatricopeptide repeat protein
MKPLRKQAGPAHNSATSVADADEIVQIKLWLLGISPMVWRRVLVPVSYCRHPLILSFPTLVTTLISCLSKHRNAPDYLKILHRMVDRVAI